MSLYRRRPGIVSAAKWDGGTLSDDLRCILGCSRGDWHCGVDPDGCGSVGIRLRVLTVDGNYVTVPVGAYVVLDGNGYAYPCDAGVFEAGHDLLVEVPA